MTINELIDGIHFAIQGPIEIRRIESDGWNMEKLYTGDDGFFDLPEDVAEMEIAYIYSEPWGNGEAAIIIEVEQEG